ncbi:hypothetical protein SISNIDRAFT_417595, partial [Sistotremastrum niveocremeum HHB9708]
ENESEWWPWKNRAACTMSVAASFSRHVMSDGDTDLMAYLLRVNRVADVPSARAVKSIKERLRKLCCVNTKEFKGSLGHLYYVNSLADIIRQEFANPLVRPKLHFYPEETLGGLRECWQGKKWLKEMAPELLTPMIRIRADDYYVCEPTMLTGPRYCVPLRWFRKEGSQLFHCKAYKIEPQSQNSPEHGLRTAWTVLSDEEFEFDETELVANYPTLEAFAEAAGVPPPDWIWGMHVPGEERLREWPQGPNPWRIKANGRRVLAFMMWLYCDDTSGNQSKKWNEHNSFLFTAAGLPREEVHKQFNIHFLCTSNIAPPLEMLEGVAAEIKAAYADGVTVWDCETSEETLVFPVTFAELCDNPMGSTFACHIGLTGKCYCRRCMVRGKDKNERDEHVSAAGVPDIDPEDVIIAQPGRPRGKPKETFWGMKARVLRALQVGEARTCAATQDTLHRQWQDAKTQTSLSEQAKRRTESGLKDEHLMYFIDIVNKLWRGGTYQEGEKAINEYISSLGANFDPYSPIWSLPGVDPHSDTLIEILHVILLGILKYLWRDAMERLSAKDKLTVIHRLSTLSLDGLDPGLKSISGQTYVKYAGSLVGRDFRVIGQVAPFVLYDLLPAPILKAWSALSNLIPLVWMPEIPSLPSYLRKLTLAIDHLLVSMVEWSPRWVNKPKTHMLKHLVADVRRIGPPILFATEGFESYNAAIRAYSIHSNRHAPSLDIARQAADTSTVRHLMSGGFFVVEREEDGVTHKTMRCIGPAPRALMEDDSVLRDRIGLPQPKAVSLGEPFDTHKCKDHTDVTNSTDTLAGHLTTTLLSELKECRLAEDCVLSNGDEASVGQVVVYRPDDKNPAQLGRIRELLVTEASLFGPRVKFAVLQHVQVLDLVEPYAMPGLCFLEQHEVVNLATLKCTVNVQHNCAANQCDLTGTRRVLQERQLTTHTLPAIKHKNNLEDMILNTAKMRDAKFIEPFAPLPPVSNLEAAVDAAVRREFV